MIGTENSLADTLRAPRTDKPTFLEVVASDSELALVLSKLGGCLRLPANDAKLKKLEEIETLIISKFGELEVAILLSTNDTEKKALLATSENWSDFYNTFVSPPLTELKKSLSSEPQLPEDVLWDGDITKHGPEAQRLLDAAVSGQLSLQSLEIEIDNLNDNDLMAASELQKKLEKIKNLLNDQDISTMKERIEATQTLSERQTSSVDVVLNFRRQAQFLKENYLKPITSLQERIKAAADKIWKKKILMNASIKTLLFEFQDPSKLSEPPRTGNLQNDWSTYKNWISDLQRKKEYVESIFLPANVRSENQREDQQYLEENYCAPASVELERRKRITFEFWKRNVLALYPQLALLNAANIALESRLSSILDPQTVLVGLQKQKELAHNESNLDVTSPEYGLYLKNTYWSATESLEEALARKYEQITLEHSTEQQKEQSFQDLKGDIQSRLALLKPQSPTLTIIRKEFDQIYDILKKCNTISQAVPSLPHLRSEYENLEQEVFKLEYNKLRKEFFVQFDRIEGAEIGGEELREALRSIGQEMIRRCVDLAGKILDKDYEIDADALGKEAEARGNLYYHWLFFWSKTNSVRDLPDIKEIDDNRTMPIKGPNADWLINGGLRNKKFEGGVINEVIQEKATEDWQSRTVFGAVEKSPEFARTEFAEIMRLIDDIYLGKISAQTVSGDRIQVNKIQENIGDLISFIASGKAGSSRRQFDRTLVTRAFRFHWCITLHQSYLIPESNPQVSDYYNYLFRWLRYFVKYLSRGTDSSSAILTFSLFGMKGEDFFNPKLQAKLLSDMEQEKVTLEEKDADGTVIDRETTNLSTSSRIRKRKKGFGSYRWVAQLPVFKLRSGMENVHNIDHEKNKVAEQDDGYCFAPPLVYFKPRENDKPILFPLDPSNPKARRAHVTFDNMRSMSDRYLYELMPFKDLGSGAIPDYHRKLAGGPYLVLKNLLKKKDTDFEKDASPRTMNENKNAWYYSLPFLPRIGSELQEEGSHDLHKMVLHEVMLTTIIAFVLSNIDTAKKEFWNRQQASQYLSELLGAGVIDAEDKELIMLVTVKAQEIHALAINALRGVQKQVEKVVTEIEV